MSVRLPGQELFLLMSLLVDRLFLLYQFFFFENRGEIIYTHSEYALGGVGKGRD